ncbi:NAD(P)/FAD-dependent oxidoreductase [Flagellimonas sp. CMM7]|uniref:NAD(P)/FAD-dependent oxidoreductase n=1 Tax=Flagellimonas sp. CMM7 TaxID=2654676 RepID=UPI0013D68A82|nr:NAD(P)/FAD-dependent oxidoreductase [Flagellimonas sp. CMM7]UII80306.1 NAD(P)/FAD-dependent oxidoreductase [Flagellimonas sp. CMM7]
MTNKKSKTHQNPENQYNTHFCLPENNHPVIVVIGAGFAGINFIKQLDGKPVQIVLIDRHNFHQFQPLLYQVAISGLEPDSVVTPIRKLFKTCGNMIYRMATVEYVDTDQNKVQTNIGYVNYDYLVIATGSSTNFYGSKSIEKNSIGLKSINDAINIRSWMLQNLEKAVDGCNVQEKSRLTKFVIVGGGPAGVEMAGALAEFKKYLLRSDYPEIDPDSMQICLVQSGDQILPMMSKKASDHALKTLQKLDVDIILNGLVKDYDGEKVTVKMKVDDEEKIIKTNTLIWTAGVKGNLIQGINEKAVVGGRFKVNTYGQVDGLENVFAIGDIAAMITDENPRGHPMVAQVAIQQGKTLAKNLLSKTKKGSFSSHFHYVDKGSMATIGKKDAVADLKVTFLQGKLGWLLWSFIHLISITGFKNRFRVGISWMMKYFSYEKANQLIIRKYSRK